MNKLTKAQEKRLREIVTEAMSNGVFYRIDEDEKTCNIDCFDEKKAEYLIQESIDAIADELSRQKKEIIKALEKTFAKGGVPEQWALDNAIKTINKI